MNKRLRTLGALFGGRVDHLPCGSVNQTATLEQMEATGAFFPEAHQQATQMAQLSAAATRLLGFDFVRVPFCQTIEAEALGCQVQFGGKLAIPSVASHPYRLDSLPEYPADIMERGRILVLSEAIQMLHRDAELEAPIVGGIVGPFTISGHLIGLTELLTQSLLEPDSLRALMKLSTRVGIEMAKMLADSGADILCIEDMSASSDMISPQTFEQVVMPYLKELVASVEIPAVLHICGNVQPIMELMAETGVLGLSIDSKTDLPAAVEQVGHKCTLIGAIPPTSVLLQGSPEQVTEVVKEHIRIGIGIIAPGCAIPPRTPAANLRAMVAAVAATSPPRRPLPGHYRGPRLGDTVMLATDDEFHKEAIEFPLGRADEPERHRYRHPGERIRFEHIFRSYQRRHEKTVSVLTGPESPTLASVSRAVAEGRRQEIQELVTRALQEFPPIEVIEKGLLPAMEQIGKQWEAGMVYLPQVILASDTLLLGMKLCEQQMESKLEAKGKVVMHVAQGDIHTIGKNIVKALLEANGFEVVDLGIDIPPKHVLSAIQEHRPQLLTGSALMTTTMSVFPEVAQRLMDAGLELPFACGGGALNQEFCESFPLGVYGGKAINGPAIAEMASRGASWQELRTRFHK